MQAVGHIELPVKELTEMLAGALKTVFPKPSLILMSVILTASAQFLPQNLCQTPFDLHLWPKAEMPERT
jgi:hypothetical protein